MTYEPSRNPWASFMSKRSVSSNSAKVCFGRCHPTRQCERCITARRDEAGSDSNTCAGVSVEGVEGSTHNVTDSTDRSRPRPYDITSGRHIRSSSYSHLTNRLMGRRPNGIKRNQHEQEHQPNDDLSHGHSRSASASASTTASGSSRSRSGGRRERRLRLRNSTRRRRRKSLGSRGIGAGVRTSLIVEVQDEYQYEGGDDHGASQSWRGECHYAVQSEIGYVRGVDGTETQVRSQAQDGEAAGEENADGTNPFRAHPIRHRQDTHAGPTSTGPSRLSAYMERDAADSEFGLSIESVLRDGLVRQKQEQEDARCFTEEVVAAPTNELQTGQRDHRPYSIDPAILHDLDVDIDVDVDTEGYLVLADTPNRLNLFVDQEGGEIRLGHGHNVVSRSAAGDGNGDGDRNRNRNRNRNSLLVSRVSSPLRRSWYDPDPVSRDSHHQGEGEERGERNESCGNGSLEGYLVLAETPNRQSTFVEQQDGEVRLSSPPTPTPIRGSKSRLTSRRSRMVEFESSSSPDGRVGSGIWSEKLGGYLTLSDTPTRMSLYIEHEGGELMLGGLAVSSSGLVEVPGKGSDEISHKKRGEEQSTWGRENGEAVAEVVSRWSSSSARAANGPSLRMGMGRTMVSGCFGGTNT